MRARSASARRALVLGVCLALLSSCANSKSGDAPVTTAVRPAGPVTTGPAADLTKFVPSHEKGVDDAKRQIRVAAIVAKTNPTGLEYSDFPDGMQAYFEMVNAAGGIYGRKIVIVARRDDITGLQNAQQVTASLSDDDAFATFVATPQFTGADLLARAGQPTFTWNINPEFASTPTSDHSNIFGTSGALCFNCPGAFLPYIATKRGFTKVGILAYGIAAESKICAEGERASYRKYAPGVKVAFFDDSLPFAADVAADVAHMKSAGVQLVSTCMDANETIKLAKEMVKQGLHAVQNLPNAYNHNKLTDSDAAAALEGSFVEPQTVPWEALRQSPATKEYLDHITAVTSHPGELDEYGWVAAKMFVDGLRGAGAEFTRQKLIDYLDAQTAYSAGGLVPPIDWTKQHLDPQKNPSARSPLSCFAVMQIQHGKFVPQFTEPDKPWICFASDAASLPAEPDHRSFAPGGIG